MLRVNMSLDRDIFDTAYLIGIPVMEWPGRCYEIACAIVDMGIVPGHAVYGHWTGPIDPKAPVFGERAGKFPFVNHGWIVLDDDEDTVVDPTRWVFENAKPYIFVGSRPESDSELCRHCEHIRDDHGQGFFSPCQVCSQCMDFEAMKAPWPYDEGGNQSRADMLRPPPAFEPEKQISFLGRLSEAASLHCRKLLNRQGWSDAQLFWLANLPYDMFGGHAFEVYKALDSMGRSAHIPIDNWRRAARERYQPEPKRRKKWTHSKDQARLRRMRTPKR